MTLLNVPCSICWNIKNECNDHCSFCYRDTKSKPLPLEDNKKILDKIATEGGKNYVCWWGTFAIPGN